MRIRPSGGKKMGIIRNVRATGGACLTSASRPFQPARFGRPASAGQVQPAWFSGAVQPAWLSGADPKATEKRSHQMTTLVSPLMSRSAGIK